MPQSTKALSPRRVLDAAIQRLFSVRYRPAQHGKAESTWRIYYLRVRACLNKAMPPEKGRRFRALAMQHLVNYVGNRLPSNSAHTVDRGPPMTVLCSGKLKTLRSCYEWGEEFYDWLVSYGAVACYSDPKVFVLVRDFEIAGTLPLVPSSSSLCTLTTF